MQRAIELKCGDLILRGMLHIPDGTTSKVPLVCIFHGFTGNKMEPHFIFVKLSRQLEGRGIASVRFDFGGSGESDGEFVNMTISKELEEAKAILDYAQTLDFIDIDKIGIVGLSMGGAVASMLAGDRKEEVKALCLWAPAGNMGELVMKQISERYGRDMSNLDYHDVGGLMISKIFLDDALKIDIIGKAASYNKNILLLHGDMDQTVPYSISERYLNVYGTNAVLHTIDGADHTFNSKKWEDEVLDYTLGFLEEELKE
jgi:uncharacterized protein